ncbi:MAG TPA: AMP-binding protein, partial [Rhodanobacter sp.]|nr:AMP-binding protein [Rhodanobacter sp.]
MTPRLAATQRDAPSSLLDVLPRASGTGVKVDTLPLDVALVAALDARAMQVGVTVHALRDAALALLESRLTGNGDVTLRSADGTVRSVSVPAAAAVADWLRAPATPAPGAGPGAIGAWQAAPGEGVSFAWSVAGAGTQQVLRLARDASVIGDVAAGILLSGMHRVLQGLAEASTLAQITIVDVRDDERIARWNATTVARDAGETVHGLFAAMARQRPDAPALAWGGGTMSYAELDARSSRVAGGLAAHGVASGELVALLLPRSASAVVAMLGVLKAGAAYLPLDPRDPPARLAQLVADAGAVLVIDADPDQPRPGITLPRVEPGTLTRASPVQPAAGMTGDVLAYVMFTSGSTGTPKGVEIAHRGVLRLVRGISYVCLDASSRVLHAAPLGFDASTFEVWAPLLNGGTCVIHDERVPTAAGLAATIAHHRVDTAWLTAALFNAVVDADVTALGGLRQLLIGGEALSPAHVRRALVALPATRLINGYGPTECAVTATHTVVRPGDPITIGRLIHG